MELETLKYGIEELEKLISGLQPVGKHIWDVMVRQAIINSILSWAFLLAFSIVIYKLITFLNKHWEPTEGYSITENDHEAFWISLLFIVSIFVIVALVNFLIHGFDILNPEYRAIMGLIGRNE